MSQQIFYIGGGEAKENFNGDYYDYLKSLEFNPYEERLTNWKDHIVKNFDYDWIKIPMPEAGFADYKAWKIVFEAYKPFFKPEDILIVNSLGGSFLLKYLSQGGELSSFLAKIIFLAPAWKDTSDEVLGDFEPNMKTMPNLQELAKETYLIHAQDDPVVPFGHSQELFLLYLQNSNFIKLSTGGHLYMLPRLVELEKILSQK